MIQLLETVNEKGLLMTGNNIDQYWGPLTSARDNQSLLDPI